MAAPTEHRIWHVPEMLEAILFELPMKDLLVNQVVCKTWKASIDSSAKLRKKLFLITDGETFTSIHDLHSKSYTSGDLRPKLNPLLASSIKDFDFLRVDPFDKAISDRPATDWNGSWRKMVLSQPAIEKYSTDIWWLYPGGLHHRVVEVVLENETGLTMEDVVRAVHGEFRRAGPEWWASAAKCYIVLGEYLRQCEGRYRRHDS